MPLMATDEGSHQASGGPIFQSLVPERLSASRDGRGLSSNVILGGDLRGATFDPAATLAALSPSPAYNALPNVGMGRVGSFPPRSTYVNPNPLTTAGSSHNLRGGYQSHRSNQATEQYAAENFRGGGDPYEAQRPQPGRMSLFRTEPYTGEEWITYRNRDESCIPFPGMESSQPPTPSRTAGVLEKISGVVNTLRHPLKALFGGGLDSEELERASEALPPPEHRQTPIYVSRASRRLSSPVMVGGSGQFLPAVGSGRSGMFEHTRLSARENQSVEKPAATSHYESQAEEAAFHELPQHGEDEPTPSKSPLVFPRQSSLAGTRDSVPVPTVRKSVTFEDDRKSFHLVESPSKRRAVEQLREEIAPPPSRLPPESEHPTPVSEAPQRTALQRPSAVRALNAGVPAGGEAAGGTRLAGPRRPSYLTSTVDEKLLIGSRFREPPARRKRQVSSVIKSIEKQYKDTLSLSDFRQFQARRRGILGQEIKRLINAQKLTLASRYIDYEQAEKAAKEDIEDRTAFEPSLPETRELKKGGPGSEGSWVPPSDQISISSSSESEGLSESEQESDKREEVGRRPAILPARRRPATPLRAAEPTAPKASPMFGLTTAVPEVVEIVDTTAETGLAGEEGKKGGRPERAEAPSLFGQPSAAAAPPTTSLFGQEGQAAQQFLFGVSAGGAPKTSSLFSTLAEAKPLGEQEAPSAAPVLLEKEPAAEKMGLGKPSPKKPTEIGIAAPAVGGIQPVTKKSIFGKPSVPDLAAGSLFGEKEAVPKPAEEGELGELSVDKKKALEISTVAEGEKAPEKPVPWWKRNLDKPLAVTTDESGFAENAFEEKAGGEGVSKPSAEGAAVPAVTSLFGEKAGGDATPSFGGPVSPPSLFGPAATPRPAGSLFGPDTAAPEKPAGGGLFDKPAAGKPATAEDALSKSLFGPLPSEPAKPAGALFGKPAETSLFGGPGLAAAAPAGGSIFGELAATSPAAAAGGSLFAPPSKPTPVSPTAAGSLFAGSLEPTASTPGSATAPRPAGEVSAPTSPFHLAAPSGVSTSLFGGPAVGTQPSTAATAGSLFAPAAGAGAATSGSLFGTTSQPAAGSLFAPSTTSPFQGAVPSAATPVEASTPAKPSTSSSLFGGAAAAPLSPSQPPPSVFTTPPAAITPAAGEAGRFGALSFGTQPGSLFGNNGMGENNVAAPAAPVGLFGTGVGQLSAATSPFAGGPGATTGSLFAPGATSPTASQFTTPFAGGQTASQPAFGAPGPSLFGQPARDLQPTQTSESQDATAANPFIQGSAPGKTRYRIRRRQAG